ncbi:MAG: nitroreductase family protein [Marinilabiliaceae bacterium]
MALNSLYTHRTIRKYTSRPIADEIVDKIVEAGIRGSNTGNMQLYSIILTTDQTIKEKLAPAHFNQPMITSAPLVVTVCVDVNRMSRWCEMSHAELAFNNFESFVTASIDATIAAQCMALAAEEEGLGLCYVGTTTYNPEMIIDVLDLPKGVFPLITLTIGYPDEKPELTERLPTCGVVHDETYVDYTDAQIACIHEDKEENSQNKKFVEENKKENLAQVFSEVRYPRGQSEAFSAKLIEVLKKQGLM